MVTKGKQETQQKSTTDAASEMAQLATANQGGGLNAEVLDRLAKIAYAEVPKDWGPMVTLFKSLPAFPKSAAKLFYALYTGSLGARYQTYGIEGAFYEAIAHSPGLKESMDRTKGKAEIALELTRTVMHDLTLSYAKELSSQPWIEGIRDAAKRYNGESEENMRPTLQNSMHNLLLHTGRVNFIMRVSRSIPGAKSWLFCGVTLREGTGAAKQH